MYSIKSTCLQHAVILQLSAIMSSALWLFCLLSSVSAGQHWPNLKTTFAINPFSGFYSQPRTSAEAVAAGWKLLSSCDSYVGQVHKFLGLRYAHPDDSSVVLIYDQAGYIAGSQSVLPAQVCRLI